MGEVAEWPIAPVLKTGVPTGTVGSNPTLSAILRRRCAPGYGWQAGLRSERKSSPPLIMTREVAAKALALIEEAIDETERELG